MTERAQRIAAWTHYWSSGAKHSCATSFELGGAEGLGRFWLDVFSGLGTSADVVDLATGNGGLLEMAGSFAQSRAYAWMLRGVDLAQPAPDWLNPELHGKAVRFLGMTPMESTGLPTASADLVISQFGVEYGERDKVQAECVRLLRPAGQFAFVIHHMDSVISRVAQDEIEAQKFLLSDDGLLSVASGLLPHLARVRTGWVPDEAADHARKRFNVASNRMQQMVESLSAPDLLLEIMAFIQQSFAAVTIDNLMAIQESLAKVEKEIELAYLRTNEQLGCAMDEADLHSYLQPFVDEGYRTKIMTINESSHMIAWGVTGKSEA